MAVQTNELRDRPGLKITYPAVPGLVFSIIRRVPIPRHSQSQDPVRACTDLGKRGSPLTAHLAG